MEFVPSNFLFPLLLPLISPLLLFLSSLLLSSLLLSPEEFLSADLLPDNFSSFNLFLSILAFLLSSYSLSHCSSLALLLSVELGLEGEFLLLSSACRCNVSSRSLSLFSLLLISSLYFFFSFSAFLLSIDRLVISSFAISNFSLTFLLLGLFTGMEFVPSNFLFPLLLPLISPLLLFLSSLLLSSLLLSPEEFLSADLLPDNFSSFNLFLSILAFLLSSYSLSHCSSLALLLSVEFGLEGEFLLLSSVCRCNVSSRSLNLFSLLLISSLNFFFSFSAFLLSIDKLVISSFAISNFSLTFLFS